MDAVAVQDTVFRRDLFTQTSLRMKVPAALVEKDFWEKATILHEEAHRPLDLPMPDRYSRHYYDTAMLAASPHSAIPPLT